MIGKNERRETLGLALPWVNKIMSFSWHFFGAVETFYVFLWCGGWGEGMVCKPLCHSVVDIAFLLNKCREKQKESNIEVVPRYKQ